MEENIKTSLKNEFFESFKPTYYEYCNNLINQPEWESVKKLLGVEKWEDILPPEKYDEKMIKKIVMEEDKIEELEGEIIELKFQLQKSKDKEMIYLDILSNIDTSLKVLFKREQENERFNLGDDVDYRECIVNLKSSLDEYKRVYKLRL